MFEISSKAKKAMAMTMNLLGNIDIFCIIEKTLSITTSKDNINLLYVL